MPLQTPVLIGMRISVYRNADRYATYRHVMPLQNTCAYRNDSLRLEERLGVNQIEERAARHELCDDADVVFGQYCAIQFKHMRVVEHS